MPRGGNPLFGETLAEADEDEDDDDDEDEVIDGFGGEASLGWGSAATANNIDSITMTAIGADEDDEEDAGGFPTETPAGAADDSQQKLFHRRSTSSLSSDDEEAAGFGDGGFASARSVSPSVLADDREEEEEVDEEEEGSGFPSDATTNLEDAYAVGLVNIGADDAVADAAAEASARELEKTYGAAIGAGLVVAGEISWGGYETTAEGEDRGDGEELQYDEPDWAEEFDDEGDTFQSDAETETGSAGDAGDGTVLTIADFKLAAVPIGFGYEDFKIKDIEHDADSLSNFVPRQLETVMEEDEPQESEVTESLSEPPQDSEHHGWMQLYVVRSGKTLNKRPKWKEKWCKLQNGKLTFQVSPNPDVSPGDTKVLDILSIQSILGDESGETPDRFIMESARQTYMVLTRSEDATHEWISELLKAKHYAKFTQSKISSRTSSPVL